MNLTQTPNANWIVRFAESVLRLRWAILPGTLLLVVLAAIGAKNIVFENSYRIFFSDENPQLIAYDELQAVYTKDDNLLFVLTGPDGTIYAPRFFEAVQWLTDEAWRLPYSTRVDSLSNFQNSVAEGDDLYVDNLAPDGEGLTPERLAYIRSVALAEPNLYNRLVKNDGRVTAVNVTAMFPEKHIMENPELAEAARALAARFQERYPEIEVRIAGVVMLNQAFTESSMTDMATIMPLMFGAIFVIMALLLRSFAGTFATGAVIMLTIVASLGLMGWFGINMNPALSMAPIMIMTLAVADSIHILATMLNELRHGRTKRGAIIESVRVNFYPVFLTSFSTAIGFLSMNFSDAPPFRQLGNVVATGVMVAWAMSIIFLPALVSILPLRSKRQADSETHIFDRLVSSIARNRRVYLGGSAVAVIFLGAMIPRMDLNDQWNKYFDESLTYRQDADYVEANLTGTTTFEFSLPADGSGGVSDPAYLNTLDAFAKWYRQQPHVLQVSNIADIQKRLNKNMHDDDPAYHKITDNKELAAQYLLLFEMSLPLGLDLNNTINVDKSASRVIVTVSDIPTKQLRHTIADGEQWLRDNAPPRMQVTASSPNVMFAHISQTNIESMLTGTALAILAISIIMALSLKSVKYGVLSLVPNIVPAILGIGAWALLYGEMGMSVSVISGMTIGIVVDDTIHFLSKYLRARREKGLDAEGAVRYAFTTVGKALVITTVVLCLGFVILGQSTFRINSWMGQLTAIVIAFALIADFLLLPALLMVVDGKKKGQPAETQSVPQLEEEPSIA